MSLIAGVFTSRTDLAVPEALRVALERLISRQPNEQRSVWRTDWCHLVKIDVGAYGVSGESTDPGGRVTVVTGDPALHTGADWAGDSRLTDLSHLHHAAVAGTLPAALRRAMGTFSLAHLDPDQHRLWLATDKCGMRPLYVWTGPEFVIFASALRVLEQLGQVPKRPDEEAIAQKVTWKFMLGDRTAYQGIAMLRPGEALECSRDGTVRLQYWRWHESTSPATTEAEHGALWYDRLSAAVARRRGRDRRVVSYLTGGMDSRAVVCELLQQGAAVDTINGSYSGELDQVLARLFGEAAGTRHIEVPRGVGDPRYPMEIARVWFELLARGGPQPERPRLIWAGVGGSVGIGHQHFTTGLVATARQGDKRATVNFFLRQEGLALPARLIRRERRAALVEAVQTGFMAELDRLPFSDPARAFHAAIVLNDTRRAFATNLEELDLHRLDSCIPMADAHLLEAIFAAPIDLCLWHGLYTRMIEPLKGYYHRVGWQTYAGHLPCPLPVPTDAPHQHSAAQLALRKRAARPATLRKGWRALGNVALPWSTVSRPFLAMALALYALGLRDTGYYLEAAATFDAATRPRAGGHPI